MLADQSRQHCSGDHFDGKQIRRWHIRVVNTVQEITLMVNKSGAGISESSTKLCVQTKDIICIEPRAFECMYRTILESSIHDQMERQKFKKCASLKSIVTITVIYQ